MKKVLFLLVAAAAMFVLAVLFYFSTVIDISALISCGDVSTLDDMEEGVLYFTDFTAKYTSESDSPDGDIDESSLTEEISGSIQSYYLVMGFDMQLANDTNGLEYLTVEVTILDSTVASANVNYANTSSTSVTTIDGQTVVSAVYSLPDRAKGVKTVSLIIELIPQSQGTTDIVYSFVTDDIIVKGYEDYDTTISVSSNSVTLSKTSLEYTLNDSGTGYSVTGIGTKTSEKIVIKSCIQGLPVTEINYSAFENCSFVVSITIPNGVTSIFNGAFYNCTSLTDVVIADSVESIGSTAFCYCTSLESIVIPDGVTIIEICTFYGCTSLISVTIPSSVTEIETSAFENCGSLTDLTIPDSVTFLGSYAFAGCSSLTTLTIPCKVINNSTFENCSSLTSVILGTNVEAIGKYAFAGCINLTSVTFLFPYNWFIGGGSGITVIYSMQNAEYLTETYCDYSWLRVGY